MKKFLEGFMSLILVLALAGCGCQKKTDDEGGNNPSGEGGNSEVTTPTDHSAAELKELAKTAGYITNDYLACQVSLTDDQMEGFTVDIQKSQTPNDRTPYCVIVATNEDYAKQACELMQNEYTTCIRSGRAVVFPEYNASSDVIRMLTSIVEGRPVTATEYVFEEDTTEETVDETVEETTEEA